MYLSRISELPILRNKIRSGDPAGSLALGLDRQAGAPAEPITRAKDGSEQQQETGSDSGARWS